MKDIKFCINAKNMLLSFEETNKYTIEYIKTHIISILHHNKIKFMILSKNLNNISAFVSIEKPLYTINENHFNFDGIKCIIISSKDSSKEIIELIKIGIVKEYGNCEETVYLQYKMMMMKKQFEQELEAKEILIKELQNKDELRIRNIKEYDDEIITIQIETRDEE